MTAELNDWKDKWIIKRRLVSSTHFCRSYCSPLSWFWSWLHQRCNHRSSWLAARRKVPSLHHSVRPCVSCSQRWWDGRTRNTSARGSSSAGSPVACCNPLLSSHGLVLKKQTKKNQKKQSFWFSSQRDKVISLGYFVTNFVNSTAIFVHLTALWATAMNSQGWENIYWALSSVFCNKFKIVTPHFLGNKCPSAPYLGLWPRCYNTNIRHICSGPTLQ